MFPQHEQQNAAYTRRSRPSLCSPNIIPVLYSCCYCCLDLNSNRAASDADSEPTIPELGVLSSMFKGNETHPGAVVGKRVADLQYRQRQTTTVICAAVHRASCWSQNYKLLRFLCLMRRREAFKNLFPRAVVAVGVQSDQFRSELLYDLVSLI